MTDQPNGILAYGCRYCNGEQHEGDCPAFAAGARAQKARIVSSIYEVAEERRNKSDECFHKGDTAGATIAMVEMAVLNTVASAIEASE